MRSQISDQDLTDYALNELEPAQRIYVESMLAVSEECRYDVYEMIDMAMLIEQGFEREEAKVAETLRPEQRAALLSVRTRPRQYVQRVAAVLAAAAAVALAVANPALWQWKAAGGAKVAQVSSYVSEAVASADGADFGTLLADWKQLADDPVLTKWFSSEWFDHAAQTAVSAPVWDPMPRASIDMMP
jgi:anti-sigma factor RsiW